MTLNILRLQSTLTSLQSLDLSINYISVGDAATLGLNQATLAVVGLTELAGLCSVFQCTEL
jgi:hypothetical protein